MKKLIALTLVLVLVAGCGAPTLKVGLGMVSDVSITAAGEKDGKSQVDTTSCAVTVDANGKIVGISWDCTQGKAAFDKTGAAKSEAANDIKSKKELKDGYSMKKASAIGKEWFEQVDALEKYAIGKTVAEVTGMKTYKKDDNHLAVPDVEELKSSCTMDVSAFLASLNKAAANAK
ncbi:MAG: hypothetical protein RR461_07380 [Angelakisella sp.]